MVEEFFTDEELQAVKNDLDTQIDHFANWLYKQGKIKSGWDAFFEIRYRYYISVNITNLNISVIKNQ